MDRIKNFFRTEWAKLREMTFREKRQYIWEYYKLHMFGFAFVAFIVGSLLNVWVFNPPRQDFLYIAWIGELIPTDRLQNLSEALEIIVENPDRQTVTVFSYSETGNFQMDQGLRTRFSAFLHQGAIDVFMLPRHEVEGGIWQEYLQPFTSVMEELLLLNPSLYARLNLSLSCENEIALSLYGAPLLEYIGIDTSDLYLAMLINAHRFYEVARALEVMFSEV